MLVGRDTSKASRMLKRAFVGGVLSTGIDVRDLEVCPAPLMRYKLQGFGESGGVLFCQDGESPLITKIRFFGKEGLEISSGEEKGIERLFARESFRRVDQSQTGYISHLPFLEDFYREGLLSLLDKQAIAKAGFRVVAHFCRGTVAPILTRILSDLGVDVVEINPGTEGRSPMTEEERDEWITTLSGMVSEAGAQVGFSFSPQGEGLVVVDEKGGIYQEERLSTLIALLLDKPDKSLPWCEGDEVLVPVSFPDVVEELLKAKGWKVRRSFQHLPRFVRDLASQPFGLGLHPFSSPMVSSHQPLPDAVWGAAWILELMASKRRPLSEVWREHPSFYLLQASIHTPLEKKGLLMRRLVEITEKENRSLQDGIKLFKDKEWVLAIPHEEQPEFLLWSYSSSREKALEHLDEIAVFLRRVLEDE